MLKNLYDYPELERVELESGRHYLDSNGNPVPSVTTVLSNTSNASEGIDRWRQRVGDLEADRIIKQSTDIGTAVHEALESYLKKEQWDEFDISIPDQNTSRLITKKFISDGLNSINEIWGLEVGLILDGLYAGTADCVGLVNGIPSIIDFKTAKKIKKREWIEDYFLQGCAYANAHNVMFGTDISQIVILMVDRDLIFQDFFVRTAEFNVLTRKWKNKLLKFNSRWRCSTKVQRIAAFRYPPRLMANVSVVILFSFRAALYSIKTENSGFNSISNPKNKFGSSSPSSVSVKL